EYARMVAEHCAARGYGPARAREELRRRGVPREHWDTALEGMDDPAEAIDAFLRKKLRGAELSDPRVRKRRSAGLARRGGGAEAEEQGPAARRPGSSQGMNGERSAAMEAREALLTRRSIRRYTPDPISETDLKAILEAGLAAPSAINLQHWYFVAVQNPQALDEIKA